MINVTGIDLVKFVQRVYDLSRPQGMGFLHFKEGGLSEKEAKDLINSKGRHAISMDYIHGRACKMVVFREGNGLFVRAQWFDHTFSQYRELLKEFGIELEENSVSGWGTAS